MIGPWPFDGLTPFKYGVILADPPWRFDLWSKAGETRSPQSHYDVMEVAAIAALPVAELARPGCVLFLWATWPLLLQAIYVLDAWGFKYATGGAWHKRRSRGATAFGYGYIFRSACEPFLIGTLGEPELASRSERNLIDALVREHSRKPDEPYAMLERLCPHAFCVELFARQRWPGWDSWGREVDRFSPESTQPESNEVRA